MVRDILLLTLTYISWTMTHNQIRVANEYTWFPMMMLIVAGIFVTIIPAIAILKAGSKGAIHGYFISIKNGEPVNYVLVTGILSSFLDNAPTYLIFQYGKGGDPQVLMNDIPMTLLAISAGAVFVGANTYIDNTNFMVKSISESSGINMPSFSAVFQMGCTHFNAFILIATTCSSNANR